MFVSFRTPNQVEGMLDAACPACPPCPSSAREGPPRELLARLAPRLAQGVGQGIQFLFLDPRFRGDDGRSGLAMTISSVIARNEMTFSL